MLVIAVAGIKITARAQVRMALVEYGILAGLAIAGLVVVAHHPGACPMTRGWWSLSGVAVTVMPRRGFWAKMMALALALSVIATTGTGIVVTARIVYGKASCRALPGFLATISRRFAAPVAASILVGVLILGAARQSASCGRPSCPAFAAHRH